jgi:hypothetical protein
VTTAHEKALERYAVSLPLLYKSRSNRGLVFGFGQTRMMSSQDLVFAPGHGLEPGMNAEIVIAWPPCLAGCGKRVLDPLKSASVERRISNLQKLVSFEKAFFRNLLDDRILLELVLRVSITDSQDGVAEAGILAYDFRTLP